MEKISWTNHVRNKDVLHGVTEEMNILRTTKRRQANQIGQIFNRNLLNTFLKER